MDSPRWPAHRPESTPGSLDFAVQQTLQCREAVRFSGGDQRRNRHDFRVVLAEGQIVQDLRRNRFRAGRAEHRHPEQHE